MVALHVSFQIKLPPKFLSTVAAPVGALAAVDLHVSVQRGGVAEGSSALFTFERFVRGVDVHVRAHVALLAELLATDVTVVRFLTGVQSDVQLLGLHGLEGFPAVRTLPAAVSVCLEVSVQLVSRAESLAAETAAVVWVVVADLQGVFEQESFAPQRS